MPETSSIPSQTDKDYTNQYLYYLLTDQRAEGEDYTYGQRIINPSVTVGGKDIPLGVNPLEELVQIYQRDGFGTNQAILEIAMPSDIVLEDPPCLRLIDTSVRYGKLSFIVYFRSWDLWAGFSSNLAGLQLVKEHLAYRLNVKDGEIMAVSKGLHLYDYAWPLAEELAHKERAQLT